MCHVSKNLHKKCESNRTGKPGLVTLGQTLTIGLIVATLVISSIVPPLRKLVIATLLTVLRISVALPSLRIVIVLVSGLFISTPVLLKVLSGLEGLCSGLKRTGARSEAASLLRIVVQVHLLRLPREVLFLRSRVVFPRI